MEINIKEDRLIAAGIAGIIGSIVNVVLGVIIKTRTPLFLPKQNALV